MLLFPRFNNILKDKHDKFSISFLFYLIGAPAFAEFACNEVVKDQFMKIALNIMQEKNLNGSRLQSNQCRGYTISCIFVTIVEMFGIAKLWNLPKLPKNNPKMIQKDPE